MEISALEWLFGKRVLICSHINIAPTLWFCLSGMTGFYVNAAWPTVRMMYT